MGRPLELISFAVQAHPSREAMARRLARRIDGCEVVLDPDPAHAVKSPWRTYRAALESTPAWATHRVVIQDDTEVCKGFQKAVGAVLSAREGSLVTFFVAGYPQDAAWLTHQAAWREEHWIRFPTDLWVPAVALAWPVAMIRPLIEFVDEQGWPPQMSADDAIIGHWCRHAGVEVWATVPSLVEHPDVEPSIMHDGAAYKGVNPARVAACYIGDCDPSTIDWTT